MSQQQHQQKIREVISLFESNPIWNTSRNSKNVTSNIGNNRTLLPQALKNYISVNKQTSEIYYYSPTENKLFVSKLQKDNSSFKINYQEINLNTKLQTIDVFKIELSNDSRYLAIIGLSNCYIVDLNPVFYNDKYFRNNDIISDNNGIVEYKSIDSIPFKTLDKSHYTLSYVIQQIEWHPLSPIHLGILFSNNTLKIYNVQNETIEQTLQLDTLNTVETLKGIQQQQNNIKISNMKSNSSLSFKSFIFGDPNQNYWSRFTIFLLTSLGDIYYISPVIPNNCVLDLGYYEKLKSNITTNKRRAQKKNQSEREHYYESQLKWLMVSTINGKFENNFGEWIKFSNLKSMPSAMNSFTPLLQGPIFQLSNSSVYDSLSNSSPIQLIYASNNNDNNLFEKDYDDDDYYEYQQRVPLNPFLLVILFDTGKVLVELSMSDTIPMWANENSYLDDQIGLISYDILDLDLKNKSTKTSSTTTTTTTTTTNNFGMKFDKYSENLFIYHNSGTHSVYFPWLIDLYNQLNINNNQKNQQQKQLSLQQKQQKQQQEPQPTSLMSIVESMNSIIGFDILIGNFGKFLLVLPNNSSGLIILNLENLIQQQEKHYQQLDDIDIELHKSIKNLSEFTLSSQQSTLKLCLESPPPTIPRISLNLNQKSTQDVILTHLLSLKNHLFLQLSYCSQLDLEVKNRVQLLERIQNEEHYKMLQIFKSKFEDLKAKQQDLIEKSAVVKSLQSNFSKVLDINIETVYEGTELSISEKQYKKELESIEHDINIFDINLDKISYQLDQSDSNSKPSSSTTTSAASDNDKAQELLKVLDDQKKKIDLDNDRLESLMKSIAELTLNNK